MAMDVEEKLESGFPYWKATRRRFGPDSPLFASGNIERELLAKQLNPIALTENRSGNFLFDFKFALELTVEEKQQLLVGDEYRKVFCPIAGCGARLTSLEEFESHYNARHTASCSVCSRVYPTSRLLSIHVSEVHDSFFQAKAARGYDVYECLVEGCGLKFKSYKSRQQHLIDKHKFPTSFEFFKKARPSKKQRQKVQRKQATDKENDSRTMEVDNATMDGLVTAVSKLSTSDSTPSMVSFGHRHTHGLTFVPRAVQREVGSNSASPRRKQ